MTEAEKKAKQDQMMREIGMWAQSHGKRRPETVDQWKALIGEYVVHRRGEAAARAMAHAAQAHAQPLATWGEIPDEHETHIGVNGAGAQILDGRPQGQFQSDWDKLLHDREQAMTEAHGDDFNRDFLLQQKEHTELQAAAPFIRQNPLSAVKENLGSVVNLPAGKTVEVARWTGDDIETTAVSILLGPVDALPLATGVLGAFRPFAILQWGTKGFQIQAEIDIGRGTQLTINASSVVVMVGLANNTPSTNILALSGMISFQPCVRTAPITRTQFYTLGAGAHTDPIAIPAFAKSFTIWRDDALMDVSVSVDDFGGTTIYTAEREANATSSETESEKFSLPGDAAYIEVFNNGASGVNIRIVFELAL